LSTLIHTVNGPVEASTLGLFLPHEHLFTDLRGPTVSGYAQADPQAVIRVMKPFLEEAWRVGVTALAECSTLGVGRNIPILQRLAQETPIHILAPTGVYREAYFPPELRQASIDSLAKAWTCDLIQGIDGTRVRAGFIKIAVSDDGPTPLEEHSIRAAARAARQTGAVIASHTVNGLSARREMDILSEEGLDLGRFIWVHASAEADVTLVIDAARRGAYVELDAVGDPGFPQEHMLDAVYMLVGTGFAGRILLSHDAGWYNPGRADGAPEWGWRGFTDLTEKFLPALRTRGMPEETIHQITVTNPQQAFAITQ
jgi:phosphotriesterase-related protein